MAKKEPKYFFRGTTKRFPGNAAGGEITCTTANPAKALAFALCCAQYGGQKVVYLARVARLDGIQRKHNSLHLLEEETAFVISPTKFYDKCEGFLETSDVAEILRKEAGITLEPPVDLANLNRCLEQVGTMTSMQIERFWVASINKLYDMRGSRLAVDLGIDSDD